MDTKTLENKIDQLKKSLDLLVLIEACKRGAKKDDIRALFGTLDNNLFAKVNKVINSKTQK